jgi:hypothetical protein
MIATSHEYKTPNVDGALAFVKNYTWEENTAKLNSLQGINKPIKQEKVMKIAEEIRKHGGKVDPFIVVNQLNGIRPQTPGKKILFDGHHRMKACELIMKEDVPVYKGTYTGGAQKSKEELRTVDKVAMYKDEICKSASDKREKHDFENAEASVGVGIAAPGTYYAVKKVREGIKSGDLTGRDTLYHNTHRDNVDSILEHGLESRRALDPENITNTNLKLNPKDVANKVYLAKEKDAADSVGAAYADMLARKKAAKEGRFYFGLGFDGTFRKELENRETLKVDIPLWKFKQAENPELRGAKSFEEYFEKIKALDPYAGLKKRSI